MHCFFELELVHPGVGTAAADLHRGISPGPEPRPRLTPQVDPATAILLSYICTIVLSPDDLKSQVGY